MGGEDYIIRRLRDQLNSWYQHAFVHVGDLATYHGDAASNTYGNIGVADANAYGNIMVDTNNTYGNDVDAQEELAQALVAYGPMHLATAACYEYAARDLETKGKTMQAIDYYEKCNDIRVEARGEAYPEAGPIHRSLGTLYLQVGNKMKARDHLQRALTAFKTTEGLDHEDTAATKQLLLSL
jgi:tetratricopeptide (TPR) repeat protein